ncbi:methionine--tRNA ligase [Agathobaculum sp. NTUH-O15-33]|uniref:methionine--tRNA ligase n=1 Tax=Agathobaculum sp. NTUH-O15-33 TaxID=3079302 RepID=UPI0029587EC8|nr:methionine--tRNA ligase [Agathobaculum sp. NTUH-O15-33]WNX85627.1 methionine--tRNA ligase [Agathobaculum sp. NTUH-O15-33]
MEKKPYYISTAIAYTSAKPHIGNTYEIVLADAIARYKRMTGYEVYFQTGTDEHGQKIQERAEAAGISPQQHVDNVAGEVRRIWDLMNTTYDKFVRTTDPMHEKKVQRIFKKLYDQGDIYKGSYKGKYCKPCESFWTDSQLKDGCCPDCGRPVVDAEEEAYFFKMSKYADRLMKHIEEHPEFIQPESRKNEMVNNFLKPGLQDLCVSRTSFSWGIPVDFDPGHVVYVWLDALTNYITFCGYDPDGSHDEHYKKFWPADVHLIGKDIIRFHTIYWPIFLMALGEELPKQVFGHPWLLVGDGKMSKSLGNVIYADDLVRLFGVDAVRYYVLHEMPFGNDGVISYELICERINSELANVLGNLVNRTIAMTKKYFGGVIPAPEAAEPVDEELKSLALALPTAVEKRMSGLHVADAIDEIFTLLRRSNKYIDETMPWALAKDEAKKARLGTVLYNLLESIRFAAVELAPYLPETADKIFAQLNVENKGVESLNSFNGMPVGGSVGEASILFERIDIPKKLTEIEEENAAKNPPAVTFLPDIAFDDFCKVDMTVCKVLACENVKKSEKLLKFQLDDGSGKPRQILSGIAKYYKAEELVGKTVVAVTNLPPRKMMGQESCGMLLSAEKDEKLNLLMLDDGIPAGAKLC